MPDTPYSSIYVNHVEKFCFDGRHNAANLARFITNFPAIFLALKRSLTSELLFRKPFAGLLCNIGTFRRSAATIISRKCDTYSNPLQLQPVSPSAPVPVKELLASGRSQYGMNGLLFSPSSNSHPSEADSATLGGKKSSAPVKWLIESN
ncbi:unnamed protein product [Leuciscus chuanchicus]